jgi:hypothetical protein
MEKNNKEEFKTSAKLNLIKMGDPKQAVILYELTPEMIDQAK